MSASTVILAFVSIVYIAKSSATRLDVVNTERSIALTIAIALGLAIAAILWLTRHVTRPLKALVTSANAVARGDLTRTVEVTTHDEIGALGTAFNQMIASLAKERVLGQRYLDHASVILLALDVEGRILIVNRYACSILEWTEDELRGQDFIETCIPAELRHETRKKLSSVLAGPDASIVENPIVTKSGKVRLVEWRNTLLRDGKGVVVSTFSSGTDITDRKAAEVAVRTAEERMRFALEAAGVGIWDIDYPTGRVTWSSILERQYGLVPGTFPGTMAAFFDLVHPEDRALVKSTIENATSVGADFTSINRIAGQEGPVRWLSGSGRIQLDKHGSPLRGVGISMDVTELRKRESQSQQAQKMEAVGRLASGVAHDFNNLLTVILGFADLMAADPDFQSADRTDLEEIIKAAKRATLLTKQLLAFGRQQVLMIVPVDVNALISEMAGMLGRLIGENIRVATSFDPAGCHALGDRSQLEQVVVNLAVNARDAMSEGGTLTIQTATTELRASELYDESIVPGSYVVITVSDTGEGMSKETQRRLFEPFFTTKESGKGTGLGLATTYGIVKQSRGYIWVRSALAKGTTFEVYLPRSPTRTITPRLSASARRPQAASAVVLLVEDQPGVRALTHRILSNAGYRVIEAPNAVAAERIFLEKKDAIDVVLSDIVMPGFTGPELVRRLRAVVSDVPVVFMSGFRETLGPQSVLEHASSFVQKPFDAETLLDAVQDALAIKTDSPKVAASLLSNETLPGAL